MMYFAPILVTAGGLFHYFEEHKVIALLRMIGQFGNMEVVFDTVNKRGMTMMKKNMKQVELPMRKCSVDSAEELAAKKKLWYRAGSGIVTPKMEKLSLRIRYDSF